MDRSELERLDRESLVTRAQAAGIRRARVLTRPELIDELLRLAPAVDALQLRRTRGFFGLARDLLSRVVERGLHLPDAAERLREALGEPLPNVPRPEPQAVPTVTLAEIYAAQGHKQRAIDTLRRVLLAEPDHALARALLERLEDAAYVPPSPPLPPEGEERLVAVEDRTDAVDDRVGAAEDRADGNADDLAAAPTLEEPPAVPPLGDPSAPAAPTLEEPSAAAAPRVDAPAEVAAPPRDEAAEELAAAPTLEEPSRAPEPIPPTPRVDEAAREGLARVATECVALPMSPSVMYVWWRLSTASRAALGQRPLTVRALVIEPTWDGPRQAVRDRAVAPDAGELIIEELPPRATVRVAIGALEGDGPDAPRFVPLACSPAFEASPSGGLVHWTVEGATPVAHDDPRIARAAEEALRAAARVS